ncbi:60s ribosomal biogenesis protein [Stagonosporopsis vannaccii]|nr:60s ribosomal biogenesis protein [Stagonosporopsis vannaccii]
MADAAPAQYKQKSRKGKKAWRKNVDVTAVASGLEEVRDQIIAGGVVAEKPSDELFAVDTAGDAAIQKKVQSRHKPLKADQILAQRSAVPAVSSRKRLSDLDNEGKRKKARISGREYDRLRAIAYGGEQTKKDVVQSGTTADYDPWAVQQVEPEPQFSFLEKKKPKVEPTTLKRAPVSLAKDGKKIPAVRKPAAGKSYNPNFDEWQALLIKESEKAVADERQRLREAQEEAERMERAAAESESDSGEESVWESEWEGFSEDEAKAKAKRPERKSATQRNRIKRRKEAERQAKHDAKMKAKGQQLQMIKALAKSVEEKERSRDAAKSMAAAIQADADGTLDVEDGEELELRKKQFGKIPIMEAPLEVVLPDELRDSLRALKPEGNLLKDRFRSMMLRGVVEPRRHIPYAKQKKYTVSEKWSYKDWELPAAK